MEIDGIVIELIPIKEEDAMIRMLSSTGIVSFFGRRVMNQKNTYFAPMQPFAKSHVWLGEGPQGGLMLKQARLITYMAQNYQTLYQFALLDLIKETLAQLAPTDDYEALYSLVESTLKLTDYSQQAPLAALIYLHQLLTILGWGLELSGCIACNTKTDIVGIDLSLGGFVCRKHYRTTDSLALSHDQLTIVAMLRNVDITKLKIAEYNIATVKAIIMIMGQHYENMTGYSLKSLKLFK
ncbi:MAG TPA: DNA repair protein RecO [Bacilli bacterium]|nr:DNA repair protein RecO [Bacilli bacterium]